MSPSFRDWLAKADRAIPATRDQAATADRFAATLGLTVAGCRFSRVPIVTFRRSLILPGRLRQQPLLGEKPAQQLMGSGHVRFRPRGGFQRLLRFIQPVE